MSAATNAGPYDDAAIYDAMYADVTVDIPLFLRLARESGGPVLELACGSGRLTIPALQEGLDVEGLDLSPAMLERLRAGLAARGRSATLHLGDMRTFALPRRFSLVYIGFTSFLHNLEQADQLATLSRGRAHLAPGGRLALTVFHPAPAGLLDWARPERLSKDIPNAHGPGRVRVIDNTVDDHVEQVRRVTRRVEFVSDTGEVTRTARLPLTLRYVHKVEMELLLRVAGFHHWSVRPLLAESPGGPWTPADRNPQEGDMLLWTAWQD